MSTLEILKTQYNIQITHDEELTNQKFFRNNHIDILQPYINQIPRTPHGKRLFKELKKLYLLDKDLRIYIYNILEEIETALKSLFLDFIQNINTQTLSEFFERPHRRYRNKRKVFDKAILKINRNQINDLYFSELSVLLENRDINNQEIQDFVKELSLWFIGTNDKNKFIAKMRKLSQLRNHIAHHNSCIIISEFWEHAPIKSIIETLSNILNNIRDQSNESQWQSRIETHIHNTTETPFKHLRPILGYPENNI